jgi:hypothetical protein
MFRVANCRWIIGFVAAILLSVVRSESQVVDQLQQQCKTVVVSGAVYRPNINGQYELDVSFGQHCSSRPVWRKSVTAAGSSDSNATAFIYYLEDGYDGWMIGSSSCYVWGNFLAGVKSAAQMPFEITETWTESKAGYGFVPSQNLTVRCTENRSDHGDGHWTGWFAYNTHIKMWTGVLAFVSVMTCVSLLAACVAVMLRRRQQRQRSLPIQSRKVHEPCETRYNRDSTLHYERLKEAPSQSIIITT